MDWVPESTTEEGIDHAAEAIVVRLMGPTARLSLGALTAFIAAWTIATGAQTPAAESLAITNVTVIDVLASTASAARRLDQTVVVSNGRIASVGSAVTIRLPRGAVVVDGRGGYLIPGLWDAHTHIGPAGPSALPAYVANGVTTIRDLGGPVADIRTWKEQIRSGAIVGPQIIAAGRTMESAAWVDGAVSLLRQERGAYSRRRPRRTLAISCGSKEAAREGGTRRTGAVPSPSGFPAPTEQQDRVTAQEI